LRNGNEIGKVQPVIAKKSKTVRFIDLFCGIGGFRYAIEGVADAIGVRAECLLSSDIDPDCQKAYEANFGETPAGDIHTIDANSIPDHDILLAGFPCQPFSIIGHRKGFEDARGTLFFEIARILEAKKPQAFVLENVKLLVGHNNGRTLARIMEVLRSLGYHVDRRIFNALDFGLPQKRERVFIVGFKTPRAFEWPKGGIPMKPLRDLLEKRVPKKYYASDHIRKKRFAQHPPTKEPTIWHENKAGHISAYPYSCALRAGASYNYLLVNGERRLTPREMLRLQGFPDTFNIVCNYGHTRKQAGNSLPVPVAQSVLSQVFLSCGWSNGQRPDVVHPTKQSFDRQMIVLEKGTRYGKQSKTKNGRKVQTAISA
jgi:DNA (cytosine-5)-methyltransferase 1